MADLRRLLILACENDQYGKLPFVPAVAREIASVMSDPTRGNCTLHGNGPIINARKAEFEQAVDACFKQAQTRRENVLIWYIGHGEVVSDSFRALPTGSSKNLAVNLATLIRDQHVGNPSV